MQQYKISDADNGYGCPSFDVVYRPLNPVVALYPQVLEMQSYADVIEII
jgi:hypothetical protein